MERNDKMSIGQVLVLYAMSLFLYVIIAVVVSGTSVSGVADIVLGSLVTGESIIVLMIIIRDIIQKRRLASKKLRR